MAPSPESPKTQTEKKQSQKHDNKTLAYVSGIALGAAALAIFSGFKLREAYDEIDTKQDTIEVVVPENDTLNLENNAMLMLGNSGVRFSDVTVIEGGVVVMIPTEGGSCKVEEVGLNYKGVDINGDGSIDPSTDSWELSLSQTDAVGTEFDRPTTQGDAAKVTALVNDFCS